MFSNCSSLKELNLSNFEIKKDTKMTDIFRGCQDELKLKIRKHYKNFNEKHLNN